MEQHEIYMDALWHVAQLCAMAAMTAPKSGGQLLINGSKLFIETLIGEDLEILGDLVELLRERSNELKAPT